MTDISHHARPLAGHDSTAKPGRRNALMRYVARFEEGEVIRCAFYGMLVGTAAVLIMDVHAMLQDEGLAFWSDPAPQVVRVEPLLPPAVETDAPSGAGRDPRDNVTGDRETLRAPMQFELRAGGVLALEGNIDPGAAARFADEIETRGEYVQTITLNSPGGALDDALAMSTLIRERGFRTTVEEGALCASSCPLVLAGGTARTVHEKAAIGLHQFYAGGEARIEAAQAMSDAQATTARISRHLIAMEVDPALWLHALDTPPRALYYLSAEEMSRYGLVSEGQQLAGR